MWLVFTAALAAIILGIKFTKDIFPKPLKVWLCKQAITNWMKSQPQKFGKEVNLEPDNYVDSGFHSDEQQIHVERPVQLTNHALRDEYTIYGTDENNNGISVKLTRLPINQTQADVFLTLQDETYLASFIGETSNLFEFSLGNLKMEMVEPFRVWRLWYNGIMINSSKQNKEEKLVHVVFNFLWKALANPLDNRKNANASLLSHNICHDSLFGENIPNLLKIVPEGFSQFGALHGNLNIQNSDSDVDANVQYELYLYGFRTREMISFFSSSMLDAFPGVMKSSKNSQATVDTSRLELFAICENGNGFRLTSFNDEWTDGRMLWASYQTTLVNGIDCSPSHFFKDSIFPKLFNIYDTKGTSRVEIWPAVKTCQLSNESQITHLKMSINGQSANAILIRKSDVIKTRKNCVNLDSSMTISNIDFKQQFNRLNVEKVVGENKECEEGKSYCFEFSNPDCLKVPLVGGKGASLAKLQIFVENQSDRKIQVARGFCISTTLFRDVLDMKKFSDIFTGAAGSDQSLDIACSTVMKMIKSCETTKGISSLISRWIERIFGDLNRNSIRFAVRSSGVLEDGSDLSCAGQNATFLGIVDALVPQKIVECWASLFTVQSVSYRLNHGQPAISEMGVVIQEIVDPTAAGVIFTADPRTGNPFHMIITANYGLGESVVSGSCDPDTITLIRHVDRRSQENDSTNCVANTHKWFITFPASKWWEDVTIGKKALGGKGTKIICTWKEEDEHSTKEISMSDQECRQFCLDEETAIKLGIVAANIELFMGEHKPVDIEWAIDQNGQIFILQCRNLTALDAWSDFEILHELDAPIRVKMDRFTTANTGEVLPKGIHTISQTMNRCLDFNIQKLIYMSKQDPEFPICLYTTTSSVLFQQRLFINMFHCLYATVDAEISNTNVCIDQTVFGRQVIDEEIRRIASERYGIASGKNKLKDFISQMKKFMTFKSQLEKANEIYGKFTLDYTGISKNSTDVYHQITEDLIHIITAGFIHLITTQCSSASQFFLFMFLSEGKKPSEWGSKIYEDASKLLSVFANVESAEMPEDMNMLGDQIVRHGENIEEFLDAYPQNALEWLKGNDKVSQALGSFFEKHGHRGFAELDIGEPSWKNDPLSFLPILRNVVKNKVQYKNMTKSKVNSSYKNDDELLDSLSSNLKPMTRRLLKFILPTCRNAVICREKSKSLFVRVIDQLKQKYGYLAKLMVKEHFLPSESLIFHLTHFEIGQLVNKDVSTSIILQKAMKRKKLYALMEKQEFPEISIGIPQELDTSIPVAITDTIQATPVSRGIAKGIAKVCLSVEEASANICPGDILITHGTDIAWSPFFPLLGGVVTELGGLISHGAVVAREYGLPCIVGAINATKIFKTGEYVILDASKGTLSKTMK